MKSIRRTILTWLLLGLAVLLAILGTAFYFGTRHSLLVQVDEEIKQKARFARIRVDVDAEEDSVTRRQARRRTLMKGAEFDDSEGEFFYQTWNEEGEVEQRSVSLGEFVIERPETDDAELPWVGTIVGPDGEPWRVRYDNREGQRRERLLSPKRSGEILVARSLIQTEETLNGLVRGMWLVGLGAAVLTSIAVILILRRGMRPLNALGDRAGEIDAGMLGERFDEKSMPAELEPISESLNGLMDRIEASFERERRFSADLAHEMRTPLAEMSAMAEAALLFPDKVGDDQFQEILASARQMEGTLKSLLTLARWDQGQAQLMIEEVKVEEMVKVVFCSYKEAAEVKGLDVVIDLEEGQCMSTDPELLRHIFENLFSNAVAYAPEGTKVLVETKRNETEVAVGVSFSNSAPHLDEDDVEHLFERFWRHDGARTSGSHSGLGLSIAKACASALSLKLDARLEKGFLRLGLFS